MTGLNRFEELRKYVLRDEPGIEVAPYHNPTVAKRDGYKTLVLDVFDTEALLENAASNASISPEKRDLIEEVDLVGDAGSLAHLMSGRSEAGKLQFILSSHNFEHLPNPIKFLQGCGSVLRPGGVLSMAIPDYRTSFDHFRHPTVLGDWLAAFAEDRQKPTPAAIFEFHSTLAAVEMDGKRVTSTDINTCDVADFKPVNRLRQAYGLYRQNLTPDAPYTDVHCSIMFGASLELMLRDLRHLGLITLEIIEVSGTRTNEFFVHLKNAPDVPADDSEAFFKKRAALMAEVQAGVGIQGLGTGER